MFVFTSVSLSSMLRVCFMLTIIFRWLDHLMLQLCYKVYNICHTFMGISTLRKKFSNLNNSTSQYTMQVREELSVYWSVLAEKLPEKLTSKVTPRLQIYSSQSDEEYDDGPNILSEDDATIPLSKLKFSEDGTDKFDTSSSQAWRSELSKIDIWYASFGSNMSESRFRCYIQGGQVIYDIMLLIILYF
ncbi:histone deacetylase 5-like isoform X2 [Rutidosis leptorrhynchoides]|uniref:histone deacetylase 5-like isoform X2 n=1 Tax=Rutidosis leptorrhynchoides TaxID=125765 RepID=UPI003A996E89